MHSDLEAIVAADEEARSRLVLAEERRDRELRAVRAECEAALGRKRRNAQAQLDAELARITAEGDARVAALRVQHERYLLQLHTAGEKRFDDAVALWLRIVCEVGAQP